MRNSGFGRNGIALFAVLFGAAGVGAQDWPQWRGANRDAKVSGFKAPSNWPKEPTKKWRVTVGEGVATPALVGDKIYVFARQDGNEVIHCLNAANGDQVWQDKNKADAPTKPGSGFNNEFVGPRSSPAVADGKVVTLGVQGTVRCYDAAKGEKLWEKDEFKGNHPNFFASCSPIVVDGLAIVQLGGESGGAIVAYDLAKGEQKWKWTADGTAYSSPNLLTMDGAKVIVAETAGKIVGLGAADGKLLWQTPFATTKGKGRGYNAATPMVDGQTVIYSGSGRGTNAVKLEKEEDKLAAKELWSNKDNSVQFNTPTQKDDLVFGISERDVLFCINAKTNKTAWTTELTGKRGYGSIVDAGSVMFALTPNGQLIAFEPTDKEFKQIAKYKVADGDTYAYPVISGNRIFIKDKDSLTLLSIE
jgi:outer membrane protein assembly factor BamB